MITLNEVSHSCNIKFLTWWNLHYRFSVYLFGKVLRRNIWNKVLETLKFYRKHLHTTKILCLFSLTLEACVISEETMRKHHIELRWKPDTKLYFKTEDNIEFMCQHGYHPVTPEHTFRTTCREGEVVYPSCGKNID